MQKVSLAIALGFVVSVGAVGSSKAETVDSCFMVTSSGKRLDLGHLCTKNPPLVKPKPKPAVQTLSSLSFPASVNLKAFLRVIRYAEGTDAEDGYQIQYTGARFYSFADHPRVAKCGSIRGGSVCSTAAGAYQFLETTWDDVAARIGAGDFSPAWQDRGAMELIDRAGAMADVESGNVEKAIAKLAPTWASFPRWYGDLDGSYSQSVVPMDKLVQIFRQYQQVEVASLPR
jgi:muramidase (phage lysozyme)